MELQSLARKTSRMIPQDGDPFLGASAVSSFLFCRRSALLVHESEREDRGEETPTFDLLPRYELERIQEELRLRVQKWLTSMAGLILLVVVSGMLVQYGNWMLIAAAGCGLSVLIRPVIENAIAVIELRGRMLAASRAEAREPDRTAIDVQTVVWWDLLACGFESTIPEALLDDTWGLAGKPWRVLRKEGLAIPVMRTRSVLDRPRPQHQARAMAYCRLLEACEGSDSPYGIILYGNTYEGVAVPNRDSFRKPFHDALVELRTVVRRAQREGTEPQPPAESCCTDCPLGRPRSVDKEEPTVLNGVMLDPHLLAGRHGRTFHCDCGDRFHWRPPHRDALKLRLREQIVRG